MSFQNGDDGDLRFYINERRNYARSDFDREFNFVQSFAYELPLGKNKRWLTTGPTSAVLGGWQVSGLLTLASGTPLTFTANGGSLNAPGNTQTADQIAPVQLLHGINVGNPWFSTASFAQPTGVAFGSSGRNILSGPGLFGLNLSLFKNVKVKERFNFELRGEAFNLTNTPQFANPNSSITSATFGDVTSTVGSGTGVNGIGGGRAVELGVKVTF
jgi:hypothetical protein